MSCGRPHATPCTQVLALVHEYLDGETGEIQRVEIVHHLEECPPCADQYATVRAVQTVVRRSCAPASAPEHLRMQIVTRIRQVSVTYRSDDSGE
jgi:mycothiol system anti-sigma-R factor